MGLGHMVGLTRGPHRIAIVDRNAQRTIVHINFYPNTTSLRAALEPTRAVGFRRHHRLGKKPALVTVQGRDKARARRMDPPRRASVAI